MKREIKPDEMIRAIAANLRKRKCAPIRRISLRKTQLPLPDDWSSEYGRWSGELIQIIYTPIFTYSQRRTRDANSTRTIIFISHTMGLLFLTHALATSSSQLILAGDPLLRIPLCDPTALDKLAAELARLGVDTTQSC